MISCADLPRSARYLTSRSPEVTGRRVQRCGAVPGREVRAAGEPADVTDVAQQPSGAGRSDAVQLLQPTAGRGDQVGQLLVRNLDFLVDRHELAEGRVPA